MLGLRGCRLGLMFPDFVKIQTRAILNAQIAVKKAGGNPIAKIMIPLVGHVNELSATRALLEAEVEAVRAAAGGIEVDYKFGTMIEVPRGALTADEIAHYADFMASAVATADALGWAAAVIPANADISLWQSLPLAGAIVSDPVEGDALLPFLRNERVPLVTIGRDPQHPYGGLVVENDFRAGTRTLLDHLHAQGATSPALIGWPERDWFTTEAISEYGRWCADRGVEPNVELIPADEKPNGTDDSMRVAVRRFLASPVRPDGVYCLCESIAAELIAESAKQEVRIPEDLRIASIGDHGLAKALDPHLTTLDVDPYRLAFRAVELLDRALNRPSLTEANLIVETTLIPRTSSTGQIVH
jgi:DNA-binding LacI/PurR family transcriptional regulator